MSKKMKKISVMHQAMSEHKGFFRQAGKIASVQDIAKQFDVSPATVYRWKHIYSELKKENLQLNEKNLLHITVGLK